MSLPRGLYETLLTELLDERLEAIGPSNSVELDDLRDPEAGDRIALHLASVIERAVSAIPEKRRRTEGIRLARRLVALIAKKQSDETLLGERPVRSAKLLRAVRGHHPDGRPQIVESPLIPLLDTALLTNAPGEPRVGRQVQMEIPSADRIDLIMAFIRRTGINPLRDAIRRHVEAGRPLRVLTTTYTGSTEAAALEWLVNLGAQVRVSYDTSSTRLHAKAWLFHRESGFSTAYVGSSNLTHSAQVTGLEWNVRVSGARNRTVVDKIAAVFESYWQQPDFEPYDRARFEEFLGRTKSANVEFQLSPIEVRLEPFQERLLEQIALARLQGHHRNLLVSATGTGKTVMAAVDYARLRTRLQRARLLFVAHREEILEQSRRTFAHAMRDGSFGELWVGGKRPAAFEHVFASIQSLSSARLESLDPAHFDVVIVDEFHHAAAASYTRLLEHVRPVELLGLTATPERSDGLPVLHWFDDRISAELRLWDAIDQHRLTPFAYYGIADQLDLREVPWIRGRGYDVEGLTKVITASDFWARSVLQQFTQHADDPTKVRALGFCVSVEHARYMARVFNQGGVRAVAVWADTPEVERRGALADLAASRVNVVFSVDLFNEGVDVPAVDMLLMLRPTDSPVLFLQQLGRGLRRSPDKTLCTVLDFVGQHRREFRYDRRFRALLGGGRAGLMRQVAEGFPFLPAGCHMELDRVASDRVLESIRQAVPTKWAAKASELAELAVGQPQITLGAFIEASGMDLDDIYSGTRCWSDLRGAAGLIQAPAGPREVALRRACGRLLHVDDPERLEQWSRWLRSDAPPVTDALPVSEHRLLRMLVGQMLAKVANKATTLQEGVNLLWSHPQVRAELIELFAVLRERISHVAPPLEVLPAVPLHMHARYTRLEILAACGVGAGARVRSWQTGVQFEKAIGVDLLAFTADKTKGQFSPTTRYEDYAISRELIHWQSQSVTRAESETGRRYQEHRALGTHVLLFARRDTNERAFHFLGSATYVAHQGERPMSVTWRLHVPLPGDLMQTYAAAVA